jgi:hypothetical protein
LALLARLKSGHRVALKDSLPISFLSKFNDKYAQSVAICFLALERELNVGRATPVGYSNFQKAYFMLAPTTLPKTNKNKRFI